jgi:hypothetical protein
LRTFPRNCAERCFHKRLPSAALPCSGVALWLMVKCPWLPLSVDSVGWLFLLKALG